MASITELIKNIRNARLGKDVRESIASAIEQTYEDASKDGNANMEVSEARGTFDNLSQRLNNSDSSKADKIEVQKTENNLQKQINSLASGSPLVATTIEEMTDTSRVYVNTTDGHWYTFNGTNWIDRGIYQSNGIAKNSITSYEIENEAVVPYKIADVSEHITSNILKYAKWFNNKYYNNGVLENNEGYKATDLIKINPESNIVNYSSGASFYKITQFDATKSYITQTPISKNVEIKLENNCEYIGFSFKESNDQYELIFVTLNGDDQYNLPWILNENYNIKDHIITPNKIKEVDDIAFKDVFRFSNWCKNKRVFHEYILDYDDYSASDLVKVTPSAQIIFSNQFAAPARISWFNENKEYEGQLDGIPDNLTVASRVHYMRLCIPTSYIPNFKAINSNGVDQIEIPWLKSASETKKGIVFGDSLWANCKRNFNYTDTPYNQSTDPCVGYQQILEQNKFILENKAVGGWHISNCWKNTENEGCVRNTSLEDLEDVDFIIFSFGANDARGLEIGEIGQSLDSTNLNENTFYGAYRKCIEYLLDLKPSLKIILWTPLQRNAHDCNPDSTNVLGYKIIDYVNAIKNLGTMYSANVIDMYSNSGLNMHNFTKYTFEGVHLTNEGYQFVKEYFINEMIKFLK